MNETHHFSSIQEFHQFAGLSKPEHPQFSIAKMKTDNTDLTCKELNDLEFSTDFYSINLKHIFDGNFYYGRTKYDYKNGSLICTGPRQVMNLKGIKTKSDSISLLIHEDFIRGTSIQNTMKDVSFFSYAVNEALHLSPQEEDLVKKIFDTLNLEYQANHDAFSKEIMISQLKTLLTYTDRFYQRQFQFRMENTETALKQRFFLELSQMTKTSLPTVEELADRLEVSPRYLNDVLKFETGKTAKENILDHQIEYAKNLLLSSNDSVATIAYKLGFKYPQYFSRLFKIKVGISPTEFRTITKH